MTAFENLSTSEKIRIALHRDVTSISNETCHYRGFEITIAAAAIIAELVCKKITVYGSDLEAFAKHAKRSKIHTDDVMLLVRRNPSLKAHLGTICINNPSVAKGKRRKTAESKTEGPAKKKFRNILEGQPLQKKLKISDEPNNEKEAPLEQPKDVRTKNVESIDLTID